MGYGISPGWHELTKELLKACGISERDCKGLSEPERAQRAKEKDEKTYNTVVLKYFGRWINRQHKVVAEFPKVLGFGAVVTTNYDDSLFNTFDDGKTVQKVYPDVHSMMLKEPQRYIFNIHGLLNKHSRESDELNVILASSEYNKAYNKETTLTLLLEALFRSYHIIFLGISFNDSNIFDILKRVYTDEREFSNRVDYPRLPQRFALINTGVHEKNGRRILDFSAIEAIESDLHSMGIEPIWYDSDEEHEELYDIVNEWGNTNLKDKSIKDPVPAVQK